MKKALSLILATLLAVAAAASASATVFTDFESYSSFEEGENASYTLLDPADYWDGAWDSADENGDELTCEIQDGVGVNGSKGLVVGSSGTSNAGLYLYATADNKIPTDYSGTAYLRVWADFTNVEFRKANFGVVDSAYSLYTTDETDGAWECKYYYSADGSTWTEYLHGSDGCFGDAQDTSVLGLKGWFAFPVADFTIRSNANWDAVDSLTTPDMSKIVGVYLFWDYSDNGEYAGQTFVLDDIELVADYTVLDVATAETEAAVEETAAVDETVTVEEAETVAETAAPAETTEIVEETVTDTAEAPQTFDAAVIATAAALVSACGYAVTKRRK